ncbi:MAG: thioester domain-containing protein [Oscillospiraceae bacterium]|jgi:hypothetical protein|nr:thioester domain-containing protein [Oscillospiraceae bacterium]
MPQEKSRKQSGTKPIKPKRMQRIAAIISAVFLFSALMTALLAAQTSAVGAGSSVRFRQTHKSDYANARQITIRDPFTKQNITNAAGTPFLFTESAYKELHAYCLQKGMRIFDDGTFARLAYDFKDAKFDPISASAKENIALVLLYGYPNQTAPTLRATANDAHAATQILLWEAELSYRNAKFERTNSALANAYFSGGNMPAAKSAYDQIAQDIMEHLRVPSFLSGGTLQLHLEYDTAAANYSQTFTDTNRANADLRVTAAGITVLRDGENYTFTAAQKITQNAEITIARADIPPARQSLGSLLVWIDPTRDFKNQLLITGVEPRSQRFSAHCTPQAATTSPTKPIETTSPAISQTTQPETSASTTAITAIETTTAAIDSPETTTIAAVNLPETGDKTTESPALFILCSAVFAGIAISIEATNGKRVFE